MIMDNCECASSEMIGKTDSFMVLSLLELHLHRLTFALLKKIILHVYLPFIFQVCSKLPYSIY